MPQTSVAYAAARIHARAKAGLSKARAERMITAPNAEEARRAMVEIGLLSADGAKDAEASAEEHLRDACALLRKVSPSEEATDCFLLRYDGMNLKMLLKARCLGKPADHLSDCGVIDKRVLRHAVADRKYGALPEILRDALASLEESLSVEADPLLIDRTVDGAIYALIQQKLRKVKSPAIKRYFVARADLINAVMLLRARGMNKSAAFLKEMMLPGGKIGWAAWQAAYAAPEKLPDVLAAYGEKVRKAAKLAAKGGSIARLESAMEDALLAPFLARKDSVYRIEPVIGYWLGAEREAAAIRVILWGHQNNAAPDVMREKIGDLYGG